MNAVPDDSPDPAARAIEEHLAFERFLAQLSSEFINWRKQTADATRHGLQRLGEWLGMERTTFFAIGTDGALHDHVAWTAPGIAVAGSSNPPRVLPWTLSELSAGRPVTFVTLSEVPDPQDRDAYQALETKSASFVPLLVDGGVAGAIGFSAITSEREWTPALQHRLSVVAALFQQVVERQRREEATRLAAEAARRHGEQLSAENAYLRSQRGDTDGLTAIVGQGVAIRHVLEMVQRVAPTDSTALLLGETGTGKELLATRIHELSARHARTMVRVNCAAIPATLIESELFGREKGAFTGALTRQVGRFELADRSTIFLDEIGDLPAEVQVKLLRVLEERTIERLGSPRAIPIDVRIIAGTHRDLEQAVAAGTFREDLYYRLNVFPIHVPPLRERTEDIPALVWSFVDEFSRTLGKRIDTIERDTMTALQQYPWRGNIRELRNVVERAMIVATGRTLSIPLPATSAASAKRSPKLIDVEKEHIKKILESTHWRIRGTGGAADRLGLKPTTLETRIAKLGLKRPGRP